MTATVMSACIQGTTQNAIREFCSVKQSRMYHDSIQYCKIDLST